MTSPLDHAIRYRDLGLSCIPLGARSKRPAIKSWAPYRERLPETAELREWFSGSDRNIAIVCGPVSGNLVVRDFDRAASYETWARMHPDLASTLPTVQTARGFHVYSRTATPPRSRTFDDGDGELRSNGEYVVAPQSVHESGVVYSWIVEPDGIPSLDLESSGLFQVCHTGTQEPMDSCAPVWHGAAVRLAVRRCVPPGHGLRHDRLFRLARELKAIPEIRDCSVNDLLPVVREWHALALPYIRTTDFATNWREFATCWADVRFSIDVSPVAMAWERSQPAPTPHELVRYGETHEKVIALAKLCRELSGSTGRFYLDCRTAAKYLDVDHKAAWRWLKELCKVGLLELVKSGSQIHRRANEYRYLGKF